jgi:hypothetical protein
LSAGCVDYVVRGIVSKIVDVQDELECDEVLPVLDGKALGRPIGGIDERQLLEGLWFPQEPLQLWEGLDAPFGDVLAYRVVWVVVAKPSVHDVDKGVEVVRHLGRAMQGTNEREGISMGGSLGRVSRLLISHPTIHGTANVKVSYPRWDLRGVGRWSAGRHHTRAHNVSRTDLQFPVP